MVPVAYPKWIIIAGLESEYRSYHSAKERCTNPVGTNAKNYYSRGIEFRLPGFKDFMLHMGRKPEGFTLERKDNNGHYTLDNCVWASRKQQADNRREVLPYASQHAGVVVQNMGYKIMMNGKKVGYRRTLAEAIKFKESL